MVYEEIQSQLLDGRCHTTILSAMVLLYLLLFY